MEISRDGRFFRPASATRRALLVAEGEPGAVAAAGGDGVVLGWPWPDEAPAAASRAGLAVVGDVTAALTEAGGRGGGKRLARATSAAELLIATEADSDALRGLAAGAALVAGPLLDRRAGEAAGPVVFGRAESADQLLGLQLDARRRPVVVEAASFEEAALALDLGVAAVILRSAGAEVARRLAEFERGRLDRAPPISVVVCAYNAEAYIGACLRSLREVDYPSFEVLVIDDGSTDRTVERARRHAGENVRVIELDHVGVSAARNVGAREALGELVAYLDADAEAHRDWLAWAWRGLDRLAADGISGPNYPFEDAGFQERAVSGAPGAPVPAVNPDGTAEHLAGCNMIFRRQLVLEVGFEEHRTSSSDDVAFCNEVLARGAKLVFHPAAAIDHHRRASMLGYLRQQRLYGRAIAPESYITTVGFDPGTEQDAEPTPWRSRLNPLKRRYIFSGAQEQGLYAQRQYAVRVAFPWRVAGAATAVLAAALGPALMLRQGRRWLLACVAAYLGIFAWVAASVPVFRPRRGPAGAAQRLATAILWLAQPVARAVGIRSARRD